MIETLIAETPNLAEGFAINLLISVISMGVGTLIGVFLGFLRDDHGKFLRWTAELITSICRNVPSFVLLFYLAFMIPVEVEWNGQIVLFPPWLKATLALTIPVIGFASDQFLGYCRQRREAQHGASLVFVRAWFQYALIILMASPTASVIGADEILSRANRIAASVSDPSFLIMTYSYVAAWFLIASLLLIGTERLLTRHSYFEGSTALR